MSSTISNSSLVVSKPPVASGESPVAISSWSYGSNIAVVVVSSEDDELVEVEEALDDDGGYDTGKPDALDEEEVEDVELDEVREEEEEEEEYLLEVEEPDDEDVLDDTACGFFSGILFAISFSSSSGVKP